MGRKSRRKAQGARHKARGPRVVASGRIKNGVRETRITFESMSPNGQAAVRTVFSDVKRGEEIANA